MFKDLVFIEKSHQYFVNGIEFPSVSVELKKYYEPFDKSISKFIAAKKGVSQQSILDEWDKIAKEAQKLGTATHQFAEDYACGVDVSPTNEHEIAIADFLNSLDFKYEIFAIELKMYSKKLKIAGTTDLVLKNNETGNLIVVDYKTNKSLTKNYKGKRLKKPFSSFLDNPLNKYKIQLNYYDLMLEEAGYNVEDKWIIWTTPNKKNSFQLFKVPNLKNRIKNAYR